MTFKLPPTIFVTEEGATPSVTPPNKDILSFEPAPTVKIVDAPPPLLRPMFIILFPPNDVALAIFKVNPEDCVLKISSVVAFALNSDDEVEVVVISPPLTAISPLKVPPAELIPALKVVNALNVFVPPNVWVPASPARVVVKSGNVIVEFASADCHSKCCWRNLQRRYCSQWWRYYYYFDFIVTV